MMTYQGIQFSNGTVSRDINVTGRRIVAAILDILFVTFASLLVGATFGTLAEPATSRATADSIMNSTASFASFVLLITNYVIMQGLTGKTPGKMLLKIKVVKEGTDETLGVGAAFLRTLVFLVDGLFFYLVGFLVILGSQKNQRLGDMVAHTLVIRDHPTPVSGTGYRAHSGAHSLGAGLDAPYGHSSYTLPEAKIQEPERAAGSVSQGHIGVQDSSVYDQIRRLAKLHEEGHVSSEEFENKKRELLQRL